MTADRLVVAGPDSLSVIGSTATAARATVGASCGCVRLRVVTGPTTYCGIDSESQLVAAVCTRHQMYVLWRDKLRS